MNYDKELIAHKLLRWERAMDGFSLPSWENIPDIGLYMDQVIVLLSQYLGLISPAEEKEDAEDGSASDEKIFSASSVNNYVRLKIMPAPVKRRYYRVHIAYLIIILTLKQAVSINIVKEMLSNELPEESVQELYRDYVIKHRAAAKLFTTIVRECATDVLNPEKTGENLVSSFVIQEALIAGFSRVLTEKLVSLKGRSFDDVVSSESPQP